MIDQEDIKFLKVLISSAGRYFYTYSTEVQYSSPYSRREANFSDIWQRG